MRFPGRREGTDDVSWAETQREKNSRARAPRSTRHRATAPQLAWYFTIWRAARTEQSFTVALFAVGGRIRQWAERLRYETSVGGPRTKRYVTPWLRAVEQLPHPSPMRGLLPQR